MNVLLVWIFIVFSAVWWHTLVYNPPTSALLLIGFLTCAVASAIMAMYYVFTIIRDWKRSK